MQTSPRPSQIHWPSLLQFAASALAVFGLWSLAAALAVGGLVERFRPSLPAGGELPLLLMAAGLVLTGLLVAPSAGYSLARLAGWRTPVARPSAWLRPTLLIFLLPFILALGVLAARSEGTAFLLLPPLHILAVGLPVLWLLDLARRGLPLGSPQRAWGVFGSGLALGPFLILIVEGALLVGALLVAAVALSNQPELTGPLERLASDLVNGGEIDQQAVFRLLEPYLSSPAALLAGLSFVALVVPLIEEALKPIGVWLLAGSDWTPAAGFAAGALCGAGYGLFESLALGSSGEDWLMLVTARIGTAVIHILNTALVGWALALAWREGRYLRLGLTYLTVVAIHGLWNGLAVLSAYVSFVQGQEAGEWLPPFLVQLSAITPLGLGVLSLGGLIVLLASNRALRKSI